MLSKNVRLTIKIKAQYFLFFTTLFTEGYVAFKNNTWKNNKWTHEHIYEAMLTLDMFQDYRKYDINISSLKIESYYYYKL